ncbi:MAG: DUF58 domain-containing protein [Lachnospiraceae bacterium]|nr:DUF58 domain-containing protein [Lachnospiraceae bacterium]
MLRNRIVLVVLMIATAVLSGIRGGTISYTLFYMVWSAPVLSGLYLFYVYRRFKIYQDIGKRVLVKSEKVPYNFVLSNQDFITYTSVNVSFFDELSVLENIKLESNYSLTPGQSYKWETFIVPKYRGEYSVGIDRVEIMDFLHLFKVTYRFPKSIIIKAHPRIPEYDNLFIEAEEYNRLTNLNNIKKEEVFPDVELRNYVVGDSIKAVNWKASAKGGELFTRKYIDESNPEILMISDFSFTGLHGAEKIIVEDKIIEASLGIAYYLYRRNITVNTMFCNGKVQVLPVYSKQGMDKFYDECAKTLFNADIKCEDMLLEEARSFYAQIVVVTHSLTEKLMRVATELATKGSQVEIIYIGDTEQKDELWETGVRVRVTRILSEQEVGDVLNRKV